MPQLLYLSKGRTIHEKSLTLCVSSNQIKGKQREYSEILEMEFDCLKRNILDDPEFKEMKNDMDLKYKVNKCKEILTKNNCKVVCECVESSKWKKEVERRKERKELIGDIGYVLAALGAFSVGGVISATIFLIMHKTKD